MSDSQQALDDLEAPVRVLYVGGVGRSGSTLVGRLLGGVQGAVSIGELVHVWARGVDANERCSCGTPFLQCSFWGAVGVKAFGGWENVDVSEMLRLSRRVDRTRFLPYLTVGRGPRSYVDALQDYRRIVSTLYDAIRDVSGCRVIVDTSKHPSFAAVVSGAPNVDTRVLHLVRDPRGVAYSWSKIIARPEVGGEAEYMQWASPLALSRHWLFTNSWYDAWSGIGPKMLRERYEDFVDNSDETLQRVLSFTGLPVRDGILTAVGSGRVTVPIQHEVAGNPMRFGAGNIVLKRDDEWQSRLGRRDRMMVSSVTSPLLHHYGYLPSKRHP